MEDPGLGPVFDLARSITESFAKIDPDFTEIVRGLQRLGASRFWEVALVLVLDIERKCPDHLRNAVGGPDVYKLLPPVKGNIRLHAKACAYHDGRESLRLQDWIRARRDVRLTRRSQSVLQDVLNIHHRHDEPDDGSKVSTALMMIDPDFMVSALFPTAATALAGLERE